MLKINNVEIILIACDLSGTHCAIYINLLLLASLLIDFWVQFDAVLYAVCSYYRWIVDGSTKVYVDIFVRSFGRLIEEQMVGPYVYLKQLHSRTIHSMPIDRTNASGAASVVNVYVDVSPNKRSWWNNDPYTAAGCCASRNVECNHFIGFYVGYICGEFTPHHLPLTLNFAGCRPVVWLTSKLISLHK